MEKQDVVDTLFRYGAVLDDVNAPYYKTDTIKLKIMISIPNNCIEVFAALAVACHDDVLDITYNSYMCVDEYTNDYEFRNITTTIEYKYVVAISKVHKKETEE